MINYCQRAASLRRSNAGHCGPCRNDHASRSWVREARWFLWSSSLSRLSWC